jgi:pimeloyl-ACP methyl ester carboxylesterase
VNVDVNGRQVFATTGGRHFDAAKPAVVFLHGSGFDHTIWNLQTRFFAFRNYSVLAPDLPGHSGSEGPPLESIEAMADWLNDLVENLDIRDLSLVAHSMGCLVALELASRYPDRLRSVSLIASGLATPVNDALLDAAANDPAAAVAMMTGWGFGQAGHHHQGPIPGNSMIAAGQKILFRNSPAALSADLNACNRYANGKTAAKAIRCPVQVIVAGKDRMAPRRATDELIACLDNPDIAVIRESGHMVPQEAADRCRALLRNFIFRQNPAV